MTQRPHDDVDCSYALQRVFLYLDGEIGEVDAAEARRHIAECITCLRAYGIEEEVKRLVRRSCCHEPVPDGLRSKVMVRLQQVSVELRTDWDE